MDIPMNLTKRNVSPETEEAIYKFIRGELLAGTDYMIILKGVEEQFGLEKAVALSEYSKAVHNILEFERPSKELETWKAVKRLDVIFHRQVVQQAPIGELKGTIQAHAALLKDLGPTAAEAKKIKGTEKDLQDPRGMSVDDMAAFRKRIMDRVNEEEADSVQTIDLENEPEEENMITPYNLPDEQ